MKKWIKVVIFSAFCSAVVGTAGYFIGVNVTNNIRLSKATEFFINNLKSNKKYSIKNLNFDFFDTKTSHCFGLNLNDVELEIDQNNNCNFKSEMTFTYDYIEIYTGSAVFLENSFYLTTESSLLTTENIYFNTSSLKEFRESFNNTTLVDVDIFDFNFNLDIFDDFENKIKKIDTNDQTTFVFELPVKTHNSTLTFYSDDEFNIKKMKTATALEYENTLISIDASNISFIDDINIEKPTNNFVDFNLILNNTANILDNFSAEDGPGLSIILGNKDNDLPLLFTYKEQDIFGIYGTLNIYNKNENDDFIFTFDGLIDIYLGERIIEGSPLKVTVMNSVYYIDIGEYLSGSIKSETLQNVFQVNKEELELQTKDMLYNLIDLMGINRSFNEEYVLLKEINEAKDSFTTIISFPVQKINEMNEEFSIAIGFNEDKISSISISDISYKDVSISNTFIQFGNELSEKPEINPDDYSELDEVVENLINFN